MRAILSLSLLVCLAAGCGTRGQPPDDESVDVDNGKATLSLGAQYTIRLDEPPRGGEHYLILPEGGDAIWTFWAASGGPLKAACKHKGVSSPFEVISPRSWKFINHLTGVIDASGEPTVIWSGFDDTNGEGIAAAKWTKGSWSYQGILDRLAPCRMVNGMVSLLDAKGNIHIAYNRTLDPEEEYSRGLVIVEGAYADKCFHLMYDGSKWSKPSSTTGRGRFCVRPKSLSQGRNGQVLLSMEVSPFSTSSYTNDFIGCQTWNNGRWTEIRRVTPEQSQAYTGAAVHDKFGHLVKYWAEEIGSRRYQLVAEISQNRTLHDILEASGNPILAASSSGRALVYWQSENLGHLRVLAGGQWSPTLDSIPGDQVSIGPNGKILLCQRCVHGIVIQEVSVLESLEKELAPSAPPVQSPTRPAP